MVSPLLVNLVDEEVSPLILIIQPIWDDNDHLLHLLHQEVSSEPPAVSPVSSDIIALSAILLFNTFIIYGGLIE
jgi:hypothetical protein